MTSFMLPRVYIEYFSQTYLGAKMRLEGGESVSGEQLPTFAESEYVTEVGQYLMTGKRETRLTRS